MELTRPPFWQEAPKLLPWDFWALSTGEDKDLSDEDFALLDQVSHLSIPENFSFIDLRSIIQADKGLYVPPIISSFVGEKIVEVDIQENCTSNFKTPYSVKSRYERNF